MRGAKRLSDDRSCCRALRVGARKYVRWHACVRAGGEDVLSYASRAYARRRCSLRSPSFSALRLFLSPPRRARGARSQTLTLFVTLTDSQTSLRAPAPRAPTRRKLRWGGPPNVVFTNALITDAETQP
eukprot:1987954-Prymnesium_polylepis.1